MEQTYLEGIENCVTKNLYSVLFGDNGVGNNSANQKGEKNPNIPEEFTVCSAHSKEVEHNGLIRDNIARFGSFVEPRHLEIDQSRLVQERIEQACHQFGNINKLKTPKGKLNNVLNFTKVMSMMLKETSKDGRPDGADVLFPCSVYALL